MRDSLSGREVDFEPPAPNSGIAMSRISSSDIASSSVMPIDREAWAKELNVSNFVSSYFQYRNFMKYFGSEPRIVIIGPGPGRCTEVFRWLSCRVATFNIDQIFSPDGMGSCHDVHIVADAQFDVIVAPYLLDRSSENNVSERTHIARNGYRRSISEYRISSVPRQAGCLIQNAMQNRGIVAKSSPTEIRF